MLSGGNQHALFHQAGRVADTGHIASGRFYFEVVEIGAAKHNPRTGGCRQ